MRVIVAATIVGILSLSIAALVQDIRTGPVSFDRDEWLNADRPASKPKTSDPGARARMLDDLVEQHDDFIGMTYAEVCALLGPDKHGQCEQPREPLHPADFAAHVQKCEPIDFLGQTGLPGGLYPKYYYWVEWQSWLPLNPIVGGRPAFGLLVESRYLIIHFCEEGTAIGWSFYESD